MNVTWNFIVAAVFFGSIYCKVELEITSGRIKGKLLRSRDGRPYYSYTGIPYAKPPIGKLRFKAPEPVESWTETLDATKDPKKCMQEKHTNIDEDCLYLNVYSPETDKNLLPVMFWIHGGSFIQGHSGTFGPEYFMDKDVILVTINYRLGVFGFLSTEDDAIPGNFGMKDQVEALRWVRKNAARFNGDPDRVTIFGGSAGAASSGLHMLSPLSKGLFHKAILQSGNPVCRWAVLPPGIARKRAHTIATIAGCNYNASEDILKCLGQLPADYLTGLQSKLYAWSMHPAVLFSPVVENCDSSRGAYLCHHPIYDFKQESFVPAIFGLNSAEGGMFVSSLYNTTSLVQTEFRTNFNRLLSIILFYNHYVKDEHIDRVGQLMLNEYFPSGAVDDDSHSNAVDLIGDGAFTHCTIDMANKVSSPVYGYLYDHQNEFSFNQKYGSCEKPLGVTHSDEITSLFGLSSLKKKKLNAKDLEVSKLMIDVWYKFASSETPTIDGSDGGAVWPTLKPNKKFLLVHIDSAQPKIIENPFEKKYKFWSQLSNYFHQNQSSSQKLSPIKSEL